MIIQEEDFMLELNPINSKFDLSLIHVVHAKDPEKRREEFKLIGYGMSLDSCFKHIINSRISRRCDTLSFKEYVNEYKKEKDDLTSIINKSFNE